MFCPKCGTKFDGQFCPKCGQDITGSVIRKYNKTRTGLIIAGALILLISAMVVIVKFNSNSNNDFSSPAWANNSSTESIVSEETSSQSEEHGLASEQNELKEKNDYISSCQTIDFATLSRNPDKYKGQAFKFTGQVIQVTEPTFGDEVTLRINVTDTGNGYYTDTIIATVNLPSDSDRILENDIITIYGDCDGLYSYSSIFSEKISLPKIKIKYFEMTS